MPAKDFRSEAYKDVLLPYKTSEERVDENTSVFSFSPLPHGFGVTIGNALRRALLSSIKGSTISSVKIDGIVHYFAPIANASEDVIQLISNIKKVVVKTHTDHDYRLFIHKKGECIVTAADLADQGVDIVNPDQIICHLDKNADFRMECLVTTGIGYVPEEERKNSDDSAGTLMLDALYNPIKLVSFEVKNIQAGRRTYDNLLFTIETNGSIDPKVAISTAASILIEHFNNLVTMNIVVKKEETNVSRITFDPQLLRSVNDLRLNGRAKNCMEQLNIHFLGDLVIKSEDDLRQVPNVGHTSVKEISAALKHFGLELNTVLTGWPPKNIEELAAEYNNSINAKKK